MRSYFLGGISDRESASQGLVAAFPDQDHETKVVFSPDGKHPIGYLYVAEPNEPEEPGGPFLIQADVSGRLHDSDVDAQVIQALRRLQAKIGGVIRDDNGMPV